MFQASPSSSYGSGGYTMRASMQIQHRKIKHDTVINYQLSRKAGHMLRSLRNPVGRDILRHLSEHPSGLTVNDLVNLIKIDKPKKKQSVVSLHLAILRRHGVLMYTREGKHHRYTLCISRIARISKALNNFFNPQPSNHEN